MSLSLSLSLSLTTSQWMLVWLLYLGAVFWVAIGRARTLIATGRLEPTSDDGYIAWMIVWWTALGLLVTWVALT